MTKEHPAFGTTALENLTPAWSLFPRKKPVLPLPHPLRGLVLCAARGKTNAGHVGEAKGQCPSQRTRYPGTGKQGGVDRPSCSDEGGKQRRGQHRVEAISKVLNTRFPRSTQRC